MNFNRILNILLLLFIFIIGFCFGVLYANNVLYPPAYPGPGDWNGDGVLSIADLYSAIEELFYGPKYPEIVYE